MSANQDAVDARIRRLAEHHGFVAIKDETSLKPWFIVEPEIGHPISPEEGMSEDEALLWLEKWPECLARQVDEDMEFFRDFEKGMSEEEASQYLHDFQEHRRN